MKELKKLLALGLVTILAFNLMACGDKEKDEKDDLSAEEILEDIPSDKIESLTAGIDIDFGLTLDMEEMLKLQDFSDEDIEDYLEANDMSKDDLEMSLTVDMDFDIEANDKYTYTTGKLEMVSPDGTETQEYKSYIDSSDDETTITYEYDYDDECWYKTEADAEDEDDDDDDTDFMDYVKEAEVNDVTDDSYVLDIVLDLKKMQEADAAEDLKDSADDSFGSVVDTENIFNELDEMTITMEIDKETNYPTSMKVNMVKMLKDLLKEAMAENEDVEIDYSKCITIDKCSIELTFDDFNKTKVEIPEDVIDEATEKSDDDWSDDDWSDDDWSDDDWSDDDWSDDDWSDDDWSDDDWYDDDAVIIDGDKFTLLDYTGEETATMTVPEDMYIDTEDSDNGIYFIYFNDNDYDYIHVTNYPDTYAEDLMEEGVYVGDTELYTRDEAFEDVSIETELGSVRVFKRIYSFNENPDEYYSTMFDLVLEVGVDRKAVVHGYLDDIEEGGYTIETLAKAIFQ